jgi:Vps51/Vps67
LLHDHSVLQLTGIAERALGHSMTETGAPGTREGDGSLTDVERLLMELYGIETEQDKAAPALDSAEPEKSERHLSLSHQDSTSLDAPGFSVQAWLESRKHLSLEMLLQQQKVLRGDITKFRNSTQTLVHDNYSRFIAAADIIRKMRGELQYMVGDTEKLTDSTKVATSASETMNDRLQVLILLSRSWAAARRALRRFPCTVFESTKGDPGSGVQGNRAELAQLASLRSLLRQVKAACQLPHELRTHLARRDFGSVVLLYSKAQPLLQSHGHHGLLRAVCGDVDSIMQVRLTAVSMSMSTLRSILALPVLCSC